LRNATLQTRLMPRFSLLGPTASATSAASSPIHKTNRSKKYSTNGIGPLIQHDRIAMAAPREITKLAISSPISEIQGLKSISIATSAADPSDIGFIKDTFQPVQLNLKQGQLTTWVGKISFPMLPEHARFARNFPPITVNHLGLSLFRTSGCRLRILGAGYGRLDSKNQNSRPEQADICLVSKGAFRTVSAVETSHQVFLPDLIPF
jgi:hypothetical protein